MDLRVVFFVILKIKCPTNDKKRINGKCMLIWVSRRETGKVSFQRFLANIRFNETHTVQRNTYFPPPIAFSMKMEHKASPYAKIFASRKMKKDMSLTPRN